MIQEKRFLSDSDTVGIDGFWIEDTDVIDNITQTELQDRLNKAHAIGFKDGSKATELIMKKEIEDYKRLYEEQVTKFCKLDELIDEAMCILYNQNNGRSETIKLIEAFRESNK